ncbi:MAG: hypothetical protein GQ569_07660 [Methylococcaceae bacterium]|nr:hypothetical protein [Methylococcaceae bacterium]
MLQPTKFSHPDKTVIAKSTLILKYLRKERLMQYDEILKKSKISSDKTDILFLPAINLLYLLGLVEYRKKIDAFEYIGQ